MKYRPYAPLAEQLARPRIRAIRALRFFDWCSYADLLLACEVGTTATELDTFCQGVFAAIKNGEIEMSGHKRGAYYRVTNKGRAKLKALHDDYEHRLGEGVAA